MTPTNMMAMAQLIDQLRFMVSLCEGLVSCKLIRATALDY